MIILYKFSALILLDEDMINLCLEQNSEISGS